MMAKRAHESLPTQEVLDNPEFARTKVARPTRPVIVDGNKYPNPGKTRTRPKEEEEEEHEQENVGDVDVEVEEAKTRHLSALPAVARERKRTSQMS